MINTKKIHWLLWPFAWLWNLIAWIVSLTGRLIAVILGSGADGRRRYPDCHRGGGIAGRPADRHRPAIGGARAVVKALNQNEGGGVLCYPTTLVFGSSRSSPAELRERCLRGSPAL